VLLAERMGWTVDYIMDMPLHQLHAVCEHLARIDRRREKANG